MFLYKIKPSNSVESKKPWKFLKIWSATIASKKEPLFIATRKHVEKRHILSAPQKMSGFSTGEITKHFVLMKRWTQGKRAQDLRHVL